MNTCRLRFSTPHLCRVGTCLLLLLLLVSGCGSDSGTHAVREGLAALHNGRDDAAVRQLRKAIRQNPASAPLHYHLGSAFWRLGKTDAAREAFSVALNLDADFEAARLFKGHVLTQQHALEEARRVLDAGLQGGEPTPDLLTAIAVIEIKRGRAGAAYDGLQKALAINPQYAPALYNLASLHRDVQGDRRFQPEQALALFQLFCRTNPDPVYLEKAQASIQRLQQTLAPRPTPPPPGDPDPDRTVRAGDARTPTETTPTPPTPSTQPRRTLAERLNDAQRLRRAGRQAAAETAFLEIVAAAPDHFDAWFYLGITRHELRNLDGALEALRQALSLQPDHTDASYRAAVVLRELRHTAEALALIGAILRTQPDYANAYLLMAYIRNDEGNFRAARGHLERFIELTPPGRTREQAEAWLQQMPNA